MKTYRSAFEKNFKAVTELKPDGRGVKVRYVYIGLWYVWNLPAEQVWAAKRLIGGACGISILLFLAGGVVYTPLNHARYVQLLGGLSIAALVFEVFGVAQFCAAGERMNCMDFRDIRGKLLIAPLLHGILLLWASGAAVWQMVGRGAAPADMVVLVCYGCAGVLSLVIFAKVRSLPYRVEKNEDADIGPDD